jgi:hypothetical protein
VQNQKKTTNLVELAPWYLIPFDLHFEETQFFDIGTMVLTPLNYLFIFYACYSSTKSPFLWPKIVYNCNKKTQVVARHVNTGCSNKLKKKLFKLNQNFQTILK